MDAADIMLDVVFWERNLYECEANTKALTSLRKFYSLEGEIVRLLIIKSKRQDKREELLKVQLFIYKVPSLNAYNSVDNVMPYYTALLMEVGCL